MFKRHELPAGLEAALFTVLYFAGTIWAYTLLGH